MSAAATSWAYLPLGVSSTSASAVADLGGHGRDFECREVEVGGAVAGDGHAPVLHVEDARNAGR